MHSGYLFKSLSLAIVECVRITLNKALHVLLTIFIYLVFRRFYILQSLDRIHNNVMSSIKLDFFHGQKLTNDCG